MKKRRECKYVSCEKFSPSLIEPLQMIYSILILWLQVGTAVPLDFISFTAQHELHCVEQWIKKSFYPYFERFFVFLALDDSAKWFQEDDW
jgi:hypothetical protein